MQKYEEKGYNKIRGNYDAFLRSFHVYVHHAFHHKIVILRQNE